MLKVRYATESDIAVWRQLDRHIAERELLQKLACRQCYLLLEDDRPVGVLRYGFLWDTIPFLNLIEFEQPARRKGYGRRAMQHWETEIRSQGHKYAMTSTQVDEQAQFFYRALGYRDTGCLLLDVPGLAQPAELFLIKTL